MSQKPGVVAGGGRRPSCSRSGQGELAGQPGEETGAGGGGVYQKEGISVQSPSMERDYSAFKELMGILVVERLSLE